MLDLIVKAQPVAISGNFDEVKTALQSEIAKYDIEVTVDNLPDAKKAATELNKLSKAIDQVKKDKAKEFAAPIEDFKKKTMELIDIIQSGREKILAQTKVFEEKVIKTCKELLIAELAELNDQLGVTAEFRTATIDGMAIQSNLTNKLNLTKAAKDKLFDAVQADKNRQETVKSRLSMLAAISERAGLKTPILDTAVASFIAEPEHVFNEKLNMLIDSEVAREKAIEERIRKEAEAKEKAEAERKAREAAEVEQRAAREAHEAAERERKAKEHEAELAGREKQLEAKRQQDAIDRAMMEAELAEAREAAAQAKPIKPAPELKQAKVFAVNLSMKMKCLPNTTQDGVKQFLNQFLSEHNADILKIDVLGE